MSDMAELGTLLRSFRDRMHPADVGSPFAHGPRRAPGLRREEVAWLASVSPDYVKRIEQGRSHPSSAVLRSIARALRLSDDEYELACRLAGHAAALEAQVRQHVGPSVQRLLDRLSDIPVAVFDAAWTLLDHNELWSALTGDERTGGGWSTNIVWRSFLGDPGRIRHGSVDAYKQSLVADLRDAAIRYPNDEKLAAMISELITSSEEFARLWDTPTTPAHGNEAKTLDHPLVGAVTLDCDVLSVSGADLRIIIFTAPPGSDAMSKLAMLTVIGSEDMAVDHSPR